MNILYVDELCVKDNMLLRGNKIVLPICLFDGERALEIAPQSHSGMSVMQRRLRSKLWWPQIDKNVKCENQ